MFENNKVKKLFGDDFNINSGDIDNYISSVNDLLNNKSADKYSPKEFITSSSNFTGKLLIATPKQDNSQFEKSIIYIFLHADNYILGINANKYVYKLDATKVVNDILRLSGAEMQQKPSIFKKLGSFINNKFTKNNNESSLSVCIGGESESNKKFILHSKDFLTSESQMIDDEIAITYDLNIIKLIAAGKGPKQSLLATGYCSWKEEDLHNEIREGLWLVSDGSPSNIVFNNNISSSDDLWHKASMLSGIDMKKISDFTGNT